MKKIGLAVCYDTKNFGSQLQVLATIRILEKMGVESEIIRYKKKLTPIFIWQTIPRLFNISFIRSKIATISKKKRIQKDPVYCEKIQVRNRRFRQFVDRYFTNMSAPYAGWENLVKASKENYDAFLCGSDQLWLPNNLGSHFYTLEFAPDDKLKMSYGTSFGVSSIPESQKKKTRRYLERLGAISTREIAGQKIIEELTGKTAKIVCDPTLLFNREEWERMIPDRSVISEPYVFGYFLGLNEEHRTIATEFCRKKGIKLVTCPFLDHFTDLDRSFGDIQLFDLDAEDFVNLIRHAEYILTDSFHGSVFSILHHKKFMTFNRFLEGTNSRNSRIDSLCTILALSERRYTGDVHKVENEIDYTSVEKKLSELRTESTTFLEQALQRL